MKKVREINKLIIRKIVEIVFVIGFIFFSAYLWRTENTKEILASISTFSNMNYTSFYIENPINYSMFPMSDEEAMSNLKPCFIHVNNETYTLENYKLVLRIDKESTLDYQYLNISIDKEIYNLTELKREDIENEFVFVLDESSIQGTTKDYEVRLWLNSLTGNDMQAKNLSMSFDLINETTKM